MDKKKVYFQKTETILTVDGEIVENKTTTSAVMDKEPDYIKLYLADIMRLSDIPKSGNALLMSLLRKSNYQNEIVIVKSIREEICQELNLADVTFRKALDQFLGKGILTKKNKNVFIANPFLFGKGSWQNIKNIRLTVNYNSKGRFLIQEDGNVNSLQQNLDFGDQTDNNSGTLDGVEFDNKIGTNPIKIRLEVLN